MAAGRYVVTRNRRKGFCPLAAAAGLVTWRGGLRFGSNAVYGPNGIASRLDVEAEQPAKLGHGRAALLARGLQKPCDSSGLRRFFSFNFYLFCGGFDRLIC